MSREPPLRRRMCQKFANTLFQNVDEATLVPISSADHDWLYHINFTTKCCVFYFCWSVTMGGRARFTHPSSEVVLVRSIKHPRNPQYAAESRGGTAVGGLGESPAKFLRRLKLSEVSVSSSPPRLRSARFGIGTGG